MNDDQRAKFEKWAADADKRNRRRAVGRVDAWEGWCACLAANAIDRPADDERERLREACRMLLKTSRDHSWSHLLDAPCDCKECAEAFARAALGTREDGE